AEVRSRGAARGRAFTSLGLRGSCRFLAEMQQPRPDRRRVGGIHWRALGRSQTRTWCGLRHSVWRVGGLAGAAKENTAMGAPPIRPKNTRSRGRAASPRPRTVGRLRLGEVNNK